MRLPSDAPIDSSKSFKCSAPDCGKSFDTPSLLDRHENIHYKRRRFECTEEGCPLDFDQKCNMQTHVSSVHEKVRYICKICLDDRTFSSKSNLSHHITYTHKKKGSRRRGIKRTVKVSKKREKKIPSPEDDQSSSTGINITIGFQPESTPGAGGSSNASSLGDANSPMDVDMEESSSGTDGVEEPSTPPEPVATLMMDYEAVELLLVLRLGNCEDRGSQSPLPPRKN